jgi:hypothetical protein
MGRVTWSPTSPSDAFLSAPCVCPTCSPSSVPLHFGEWLGTRIFAITGCPEPPNVGSRPIRWLSFLVATTKRGKGA